MTQAKRVKVSHPNSKTVEPDVQVPVTNSDKLAAGVFDSLDSSDSPSQSGEVYLSQIVEQPSTATPVADSLIAMGKYEGELRVQISNEMIRLLSEQLYQSPLKALEELVVNGYDADATECRVYAPLVGTGEQDFVVVYDNGSGMDYNGLVDLWHIGHSRKRDEEIELRSKRKQIGKFGIGKLATYAIAGRVTYLSKRDGKILAVTLNYDEFSANNSGAGSPVVLGVRQILDQERLSTNASFRAACQAIGIPMDSLLTNVSTWTFCILEALKDKARAIQFGRLRWILQTAMPLSSQFRLFLNATEITSSKGTYTFIVDKPLTNFLPSSRVTSLCEVTRENWRVEDGRLVCDAFPSGIAGEVRISAQSLSGKSDDLGRSHGFFIRVRGRLISERDPFFGLPTLSLKSFSHIRVELTVDDLDDIVTAPREGVTESPKFRHVQVLLREIFNEARPIYEKYEIEHNKEAHKKEEERNYVNPGLIEHSVADVLANQTEDGLGSEADDTWFYLHIEPHTDRRQLIQSLFNDSRSVYKYIYSQRGRAGRLATFNPANASFTINEDHDLVQAYSDDGRARWLLEDVVTAETMLEIYLREHGMSAHTIGEILEQRDTLLRSLAKDHPFSLALIANALRESVADENELEIQLVAALRALGFVAKHISGSGEPDGIARFTDYPSGEKKITLEAKSSISVPSLNAIDFANIARHARDHRAQGTLLIAPIYPGQSLGNASAVASCANSERVSCWTVDQLARLVESAEARQINARNILDIVLNSFAPADVEARLDTLLKEPGWEQRDLYQAIIQVLREIQGRATDRPRTIDQVTIKLSDKADFQDIKYETVEHALLEVAYASKGLMTISDDKILIHGSYDEIERRLNGLTGESGSPRRLGTFRQPSIWRVGNTNEE